MKITRQDLRRIIKEELQTVMDEDYSMLSNMTPGDALAYIEENLNGKTWVFWDLETIGFKGQITQYGALAFKIEDIAGPAPSKPVSSFEVNVALSDATKEQMAKEEALVARADEIYNAEIDAYRAEQEVSDEFKFIRSMKKAHENGRPHTVKDMLDYTHHVPSESDMDEKEALQQFVDWFTGLGDNILSAGHNIISFDRRRIIAEGQRLGVDTSVFEDLDVFDTLKFQRELMQNVAREMMERGDEKMTKFFHETEKKIKGEIKKVMAFNGKLQKMMDLYGPGPDYVQLHTAVDDTKQLVEAFFKIYADVKKFVENPEIGDMTRYINVKKGQKELGRKDLEDPRDISRAISDFRRD